MPSLVRISSIPIGEKFAKGTGSDVEVCFTASTRREKLSERSSLVALVIEQRILVGHLHVSFIKGVLSHCTKYRDRYQIDPSIDFASFNATGQIFSQFLKSRDISMFEHLSDRIVRLDEVLQGY